jgi:hypothetical protein
MEARHVLFDVERPERFERSQLALRFVLLLLLGLLGGSLAWIFAVAYLALPAAAAVFVSQHGPDRYLAEDAPRVTRWVHALLVFYSYLALLTDELRFDQVGQRERPVRFEVQPDGQPTVGSALLRLLYSIPATLLLLLLGLLSGLLWLVSVVLVLVRRDYPDSIYQFQRAVYRYLARLFAYHASLVDEYPSMEFEQRAPIVGGPPAGPV